MNDWRNAYIHIDTDGGGARMDIRYDSGAFDFSINGVNEFTMAKEDAIQLIAELTQAIREEENRCPYCGSTEHTFEDGDSDGYDNDGDYFDRYWCSCNKCKKTLIKTKVYVPYKVVVEKEEDVE